MDAEKKLTQEQMVLEHLRDFGSITTWESFTDYGITRLSAKIFNLRKEGYNITSTTKTAKNRYNKIISFSEYRLDKTLDNKIKE